MNFCHSNNGAPIGIPNFFASFDREIIQPSLFERTTTGFCLSETLKTRSHETKKLLQSTSPKIFSDAFVVPMPIFASSNGWSMSQLPIFQSPSLFEMYHESGPLPLAIRIQERSIIFLREILHRQLQRRYCH